MSQPPRQRSVQFGAVLTAVRRKARRHGLILRRCRPCHWNYAYLGDLYTVCSETGFVERTKIDLRSAAIDLGIIDAGQQLEPPQCASPKNRAKR